MILWAEGMGFVLIGKDLRRQGPSAAYLAEYVVDLVAYQNRLITSVTLMSYCTPRKTMLERYGPDFEKSELELEASDLPEDEAEMVLNLRRKDPTGPNCAFADGSFGRPLKMTCL